MSLQSAPPGEIITFGIYPQTTTGIDRTPIEWLVLENSGSELFLLSKYILDCKRYHSAFEDTSWRKCDLRQWLNDEFYHFAFNHAEKKVVKITHNMGDDGSGLGTKDKVFLLGVADVNSLTNKFGKAFRRARGTEFAKMKKADGCHLYVMDKNVDADYLYEDGKKYGCSWWLLRDEGRLKEKGNDPSRVVFIGTRASIRHYARVDLAGYGVRPAIKLDLSDS